MSRVEASTKKDVHKYTNHSIPPADTMGSYYDIDAILTDSQVRIQLPRRTAILERASRKREQHTHNPILQQKVPCTFDLTVPGLGHMEGNTGGDVCIHPAEAPG